MTAFAAMFLTKATMTYGHQLIERLIVIDLISRLVTLYHSTIAGKFHLVNMMANGLEKLTTALRDRNENSGISSHDVQDTDPFDVDKYHFSSLDNPDLGGENVMFDENFLMDFNMNIGTSAMHLSHGPTVFGTTDLSPSFL